MSAVARQSLMLDFICGRAYVGRFLRFAGILMGILLWTICCGRYVDIFVDVVGIFVDVMLRTFFADVTLVYLWFADILTGVCCGCYCCEDLCL